MVLFLVITALLLLGISLLLFVPETVQISYELAEKKQKLTIRFWIFRIPFSVNIPLKKEKERKEKPKKKKEKNPKEKRTIRDFIAFSKELKAFYQREKKDIHEAFIRLQKGVSCRELAFRVDYGTKNPAVTGMLNGAAWTAGTILLKIMDKILGIEKKSLYIYPDFQKEKLCIHIKGVFHGRAFDVACFIIKIIQITRRLPKQSEIRKV